MTDDRHGAALAKLERLLETAPPAELQPEEIAVLREMITAWRGLTAFGWLTGKLRRWAWPIGVGIGLYLALRGKPGVLDSLLRGPPS